MFKPVIHQQDIDQVVELAHIIWTEHYTPIIGSEQVDYMLTHFHSKAEISKQIAEQNYHFYLIINNDKAVGYCGFQLQESDLFLSKLYLLSSERGQGLGKLATNFIIQTARDHHKSKVYLTVNKYNHGSINAYYKIGFTKVKELCADIGGGYVMDDYQLELNLSPDS
jgi:RimJ/RimL family protein N-acetyltransferase